MAIWAVIPAAGVGERFGAGRPKQYLALAGRPLLRHSLDLFLGVPAIDGVVVAVAANDGEWPRTRPDRSSKPLLTVLGGRTRAESVVAALAVIADRIGAADWALVHDAARPCLAADELERLIGEVSNDPVGGLLAVPLADTLKRAGEDGRVAGTIERAGLWQAQTPQMFRYGLLRQALADARAAGAAVTDEAMAMERAGFSPRLVAAPASNIKITRREDLLLAEAVLAARGMVESPR